MSQKIDVTGLSPEQVQAIQAMVNGYRRQAPAASNGSPDETPEERARRFVAWADAHPPIGVEIDDDRETIYGGRGE